MKLILFYDFEVFRYDWLVVIMDMKEKKTGVIANSRDELEAFYNAHKNYIWCGFNSTHYDQYILKGILCGFDPKKINDFIIRDGEPGWKFSSLLRQFPLNSYDVMNRDDKGLKSLEGFMGNGIKETGVPFDIDRQLTNDEMLETVKYCRHDVEQTVRVFMNRKNDFGAHLGLVKLACEGKRLDLSLLSKTKPQLAAIILEAEKKPHDDEFDIDFPSTMRIEKYADVVKWYENPESRCYEKNGEKNQLEIPVAGVPHQFGWGGLHGARNKYHSTGCFINMDVSSLYPSLMIRYNLHSRNMSDPEKYVEIYNQRLRYKAEKNPMQLPLKLVLNSTYGVMKDERNPLYDPRQANRVCVYGQLLVLDLIEHLEPYAEIIQSNTDGVLIRMPDNSPRDMDVWYDKIDDVAFEWEERTGLKLEFDEYQEVFQKDVNNYILIDDDRNYKSKGSYVKQLSSLDYDLPIVNKAMVEFMVNGVTVESTIGECDDLKEFQQVAKISSKYTCILYGNRELNERCVRIFASKNGSDPGVRKVYEKTGKPVKIPNSPEHSFIYNGDVNGIRVPEYLDKQWYIDLARKRLEDFGAIQE